MIAENIYSIAIHLPEKDLEKLYIMLGKKVNHNSNYFKSLFNTKTLFSIKIK
jgi:hypothetical protein